MIDNDIRRQCIYGIVDIYNTRPISIDKRRLRDLNYVKVLHKPFGVQSGIPKYIFLNPIFCTFSALRNSHMPLLNELIS